MLDIGIFSNCILFYFYAYDNYLSSGSPKYLTELVVGTGTPLMFMFNGSLFRRYVNNTSFNLVGFTETRQLAHLKYDNKIKDSLW
jgi:hypothetical protein